MNWNGSYIVLAWASFLATLTFWLWTESALVNAAWCVADDNHCLREWIGALSGWAAAIAAVATATLTIKPLRDQVREARRQSDFLVGDAEPEFIILRNKAKRRTTLKATNWNRRPVMIESVVASGAYGISVHNVVSWAEEEGEPTREEQDALRKIPNFRLEGWSDRSEPPPQRRFVVVFAKDGEPTRDPTILRSAIKLRIDFRIIGQTHERKSIIAAVLVQTEPDDS